MVNKQKEAIVKQFVDLIESHSVIGAVNMENLPARQLQDMRESLRGDVTLLMTKRRLMKIAIESSKKKNIIDLLPNLKGMPALMFTEMNPFKLAKTLDKNKSKAPAKAGQTAPNDIVVPAGPTNFSPGPIIGELGALGLKTGIEGGKVAIKEDKVVLKEGETITAEMASVLARLDIKPMEIGLNISAIYENGVIFSKNVLSIDETEYTDNITKAAMWAFNLAIDAGIVNDVTAPILISRAYGDAVSLALSQNIMASEVKEMILSKAYNQMLSVASKLPEDVRPNNLPSVAKSDDLKEKSEEKSDNDKDEPKDKPKETDVAAGLGALFGG